MLRKLILLSAPLLLATPAWADLLLFSVTPDTVQTLPGGTRDPTCQNYATLDCVIFSGNISFTTDQYYALNDIEIDIPDGGSVVVGNDNYFYAYGPPGTMGGDGTPADTINPCGSNSCYAGGLFEIDVSSSAPYGAYDGTATLDYTEDTIGAELFAAESFEVDVVPEPGMSTLVLFGIASLAAMGRRRRPHRGK